MIKSFIILVLLVILSAGLFLTRPNKDTFVQQVVENKQSGSEGGLLGSILGSYAKDQYVESCVFSDKLLWTQIQRNGKTTYYGVFGRWWGSDPDVKSSSTETKSTAVTETKVVESKSESKAEAKPKSSSSHNTRGN